MKRINLQFKNFDYQNFVAMISRNRGQSVVGLILRLAPAMQGRITTGLAVVTKVIMNRFSLIARTQGVPGLVKYLKAASVLTQQAICGYYVSDYSPRISRTNSGLPRILPPAVRRLIRSGNHFYMKWALSVFSVYRDMLYDSPIKLSSITNPFSGDDKMVQQVIGFIPLFAKLFCPIQNRRYLLKGKFSFLPINKSSPQALKALASTHPGSLVLSARAFSEEMLSNLEILSRISAKSTFGLNTEGKRVEIPQEPTRVISLIRRLRGWKPETVRALGLRAKHSYIGKLGLKQEAAGKMRVFAMVDPWTQLVLAPFHKALFQILRDHPMDGTFNQLKPLSRAWGHKSLYSMDLSTATDRLPMSVQVPLIQAVLDLTVEEANAWRALLVERPYMVPEPEGYVGKKLPNEVFYSVGQPMGALSSWAMLAVTHHLIVQCAAWMSGHSQKALFVNYAVLGDDIVIFDRRVAKSYQKIINGLGVECNLAKSILSYKGIGLEFAKKTFYKGVNISPTPLKELHAALKGPVPLIQYMKIYGLSLPQLMTVAGYGYRIKGSANSPFWKISNYKLKLLMMSFFLMDETKLLTLFQRRQGKALGLPLTVSTLDKLISQSTRLMIRKWNEAKHKVDKIIEMSIAATAAKRYNQELIQQMKLRVSKIEVNFPSVMKELACPKWLEILRFPRKGEVVPLHLKRGNRMKDLKLSGFYADIFYIFYIPYAKRLSNLLAEGKDTAAKIRWPFSPIHRLPNKGVVERVKAMIEIESKVSSLSIDNLSMRRENDKAVLPGLMPKVGKLCQAYDLILNTIIHPVIKPDLKRTVPGKAKPSLYRASGFDFSMMNLLRRIFFISTRSSSALNRYRLVNKPLPSTVKGMTVGTLIWFWVIEGILTLFVSVIFSYCALLLIGLITLLSNDNLSYGTIMILFIDTFKPALEFIKVYFGDFHLWIFPVGSSASYWSLIFDAFLRFNLWVVSLDMWINFDHITSTFSAIMAEEHWVMATIGASFGTFKVYLIDFLGHFYWSVLTGWVYGPTAWVASIKATMVFKTIAAWLTVIFEYLVEAWDYIQNGETHNDIPETSSDTTERAGPSNEVPVTETTPNPVGAKVWRACEVLASNKYIWTSVAISVSWWLVKRTATASMKLITS